MRLLKETEPITYVSDWFELHDAVLHLRSYQQPTCPWPSPRYNPRRAWLRRVSTVPVYCP